jgi:hypothetical protein
MPVSGDLSYLSKSAARGKFAQLGSFSLTDAIRRPLIARLRLYERMWRQDLTIKTALHTQVNSIVGTIGELTHPDPEIAEFLNDNIKQLEDEHGRSWQNCLSTIQHTSFWAGYSLTEVMFDLKFGQLYLHDLLTYHPSTCLIYPDKHGRLTEGKPTMDGYHKSGFYQVGLNPLQAEVKLPLWKTLYLANESDYGNYYGRSLIAPSYKWYRLKEAIIDMMGAALDKTGSRMTSISIPSYELPEKRLDVSTGEQKPITTLDLVREQLENIEGPPEFLFLPQQSPENKPTVNSVPLFDNVGTTFLDAIAYTDQESTKHILPYFLISDHQAANSKADPEAKERRMEAYYNALDSHRRNLTSVVLRKVMMPLVEWNFSRASAKIPPTFTRVYSDRPEDRVATMQMVKGLTDTGYLNPTNPQDWDMVRQMVRLSDRKMDADDLRFIQQVVINPLLPKPGADETGKGGTGGRGRPTGNSMPNRQARLPAKPAA